MVGEVVVIAEKPIAGERIASFLANHFNSQAVRREYEYKGATCDYYEVDSDSLRIFVVSLAGHIVQPELKRGRDYPKFEWYLKTPTKGVNRARWELLKELVRRCDVVIGATDNDEEGEVMLYYTIQGFREAKVTDIAPEDLPRMIFVELTENSIVRAFEEALNGNTKLRMNWANAGHWRHLLDLWYGKNISNLFSRGAVMHGAAENIKFLIGRVKIPMLHYIAQEEEEILQEPQEVNFRLVKQAEEEPEYVARVYADFYGKIEVDEVEVRGDEISEVLNSEWRGEVVGYEDGEEEEEPERWVYNTRDVLTEASNKGIPMSKAKTILENLYVFGYISYPRTESRKLAPDRDYNEIIERLSAIEWIDVNDFEDFSNLTELHETEEKGHVGIYPTGKIPDETLPQEYLLIWELITRRFLVAMAKPAKYRVREVEIAVYRDGAEYKRVFKKFWEATYWGWKKYDAYSSWSDVIPDVSEGEDVKVRIAVETRNVSFGDSLVKKIRNYVPEIRRIDESQLYDWMYYENLGTMATRESHIEQLRAWKYASGEEKLTLTAIGQKLAVLLKKYIPVTLQDTKDMYSTMDELKDGFDLKEALERAKERVEEIYYSTDIDELGKELNNVGKCTICGSKARLVFFERDGEVSYAIGCSRYPECKFLLPLA